MGVRDLIPAGLALLVSSAVVATAPSQKTTKDGVYTKAQADKVAETYAKVCANCHDPAKVPADKKPAPPLTGDVFFDSWKDRTLGELMTTIRLTMPNDGSMTLTVEDAENLTALILQMNKFPEGKEALKNDDAGKKTRDRKVTTDPRIDAYIKKAPEYARPILTHIRNVVHDACPDVQETLKWRSPSFEYRGLLCGMAAFKRCALLGFWKSKVLVDRGFAEVGRLTTVADLPPDAELGRMVKAAMLLNEQGIKTGQSVKSKKPPVEPPAYFLAAVQKNRKALTHFQAFSPSHKREYVEWVTEAKGDDTRQRRLTQAIAWIAEGKSRNWKYQ